MPNGYGSVVKLTGKRRKNWAVRISYMENIPGQKPKRKRKYIAYFTDQKRALEYLTEYNSGAIVKEHEKYSDIPTFAELYDKWKKYRKGLKIILLRAAGKITKLHSTFFPAFMTKK